MKPGDKIRRLKKYQDNKLSSWENRCIASNIPVDSILLAVDVSYPFITISTLDGKIIGDRKGWEQDRFELVSSTYLYEAY